MQLFRYLGYAFIILVVSLDAQALKKRQAYEEIPNTEQELPSSKQRARLGCAVNYADMANFSLYVKRADLNDIKDLKGLKDKEGEASNFRVNGQKYGHYITHKSLRAKNWNKTKFHNFSLENMNSHSVNAHRAQWSHFYISGSISDWKFQKANLENGWFNAQMKNCDFRGAYLRNVGFYGAKLTKTHNLLKMGKSINFDGAVLENVTFKGSDLKRATFKGTIFRSNVRFEDANVHFATQFAGAEFVDNSGKGHIITKDQADKLDKKVQAYAGQKSITSDEIMQIITPQ